MNRLNLHTTEKALSKTNMKYREAVVLMAKGKPVWRRGWDRKTYLRMTGQGCTITQYTIQGKPTRLMITEYDHEQTDWEIADIWTDES